MAELKLVEGWSSPIDETLKSDGVAVDLTGMTVELLLQKADGSLVDTTGDVSVVTPGSGLVRYTPDAADLLAADSPHVARWKVTNAGKVTYFPNEAGEVWDVLPIGTPALQDNALLSVADLKGALGIKNSDQDVALAGFINACADALETLTGRRLKTRTYTNEYLYVRADRVLGCEWFDVESPITALTALEYDGAVQTRWMPGDAGSPEDFDVYVLEARDPKHGRDRIFRRGGWAPGALVKRTYTAGYGVVGPPAFPVPGDLKQAILVLARDWYYLRDRQLQNVQSRSADGQAVTYVNDALPRQFRALLLSYQRVAA
jgi:uncharacterized phiE125 gp8 family phage protein